MKKLPKELHKYFWEVDPNQVDVDSRPEYVISRLMDYGHSNAIRWMKNQYSETQIRETLHVRRGISRQSGRFWSLLLGLEPKEVKCLQKPYRQIPYGV